MLDAGGPLAEFLRASRGRLDPAEAGLVFGGTRRVSGLRREEVAVLAGVSAGFYARLEQGSERSPSVAVVGAIGRALRLGAADRGRLYELAGMKPETATLRGQAHPSLIELLDAFPNALAYVLNPALDVLATNPVAVEVFSPFTGSSLNVAEVLFGDPVARTVFVDWSEVAADAVQKLRLHANRFVHDSRVAAVIADLRATSDEFRTMWDAGAAGRPVKSFQVFVHPTVGRLEVTYQTFDVRDAPDQVLRVGTPTAGSVAALARLK